MGIKGAKRPKDNPLIPIPAYAEAPPGFGVALKNRRASEFRASLRSARKSRVGVP